MATIVAGNSLGAGIFTISAPTATPAAGSSQPGWRPWARRFPRALAGPFPGQRPSRPHQGVEPVGQPVASFGQERQIVLQRHGLRELTFDLAAGAVRRGTQMLDATFRLMGAGIEAHHQ